MNGNETFNDAEMYDYIDDKFWRRLHWSVKCKIDDHQLI